MRSVGGNGLSRHGVGHSRIGDAQKLHLPREFRTEHLLGQVVIRIPGGVEIHVLRRVEAPELPLVGQRLPGFVEIARVAMVVLHDEFRDGRPGAIAALRLALTPPGRVRFALVPRPHRFGEEVLQPERLPRLLPVDGLGQLAQQAGVDPFEQFGDRRLTDPESAAICGCDQPRTANSSRALRACESAHGGRGRLAHRGHVDDAGTGSARPPRHRRGDTLAHGLLARKGFPPAVEDPLG